MKIALHAEKLEQKNRAAIRKGFARNLRRLMVEKGFDKQWALAAAAGVRQSMISEYLRENKTPTLDSIARIADALDVAACELLQGINIIRG